MLTPEDTIDLNLFATSIVKNTFGGCSYLHRRRFIFVVTNDNKYIGLGGFPDFENKEIR